MMQLRKPVVALPAALSPGSGTNQENWKETQSRVKIGDKG